jgi:aminoglycoside phosphotransferase family enzyme/predicted kinase
MDRSLIEQMLDPTIYPEPTKTVTHLQTHISHLFLTDSAVYKIKKPVDFGFLDFSTLEKRRFYCLEELRLNRRLSPEIYLDLVALRDNGTGGVSLSGDGPVLEYAVKMLRMPEERMMARLLERREVTITDIDAIARKVARFHAEAARGNGIELFGTIEAIRNNWIENLKQTKAYLGRTLSEQDHRLIGDWALERLRHDAEHFNQRITGGFIRECDGDLHTENICLDGQVHIFDCIEFNERFRYSDTAADVAFLAMDLENHGRLDLAQRFVEQYIELSADTSLQQVLSLYLVNRAFIRGKVESFRLDDPLISDDEKTAATARAERFFRLARGYILRKKIPKTLFLTCGPTGSGKTAVANELAFQLGLHHYSSDQERKRLAGVEPTERCSDIYNQSWNQATYARLLELARNSLHASTSTVVDATFRTRRERQQFIQMAAAEGVSTVILRLSCPADLIRQRLEIRQSQDNVISDGTWEIYQQQMTTFEEPAADEALLMVLAAALKPAAQVNQVFENTSLFTP